MGRQKTHNAHLPPRMRYKHGSYYHVSSGGDRRWRKLGREYTEALRAYADIEEDVVGAVYIPRWREQLYQSAKRSAKRRRIRFDLSWDDFMALIERSDQRCAITGISFAIEPTKGRRSPWAPSLDRIDSNLGYSFENCRVVCVAVNYALNEWGTDVLIRIADALMQRRNAA